MNQSEILAITCNLIKVRNYVRQSFGNCHVLPSMTFSLRGKREGENSLQEFGHAWARRVRWEEESTALQDNGLLDFCGLMQSSYLRCDITLHKMLNKSFVMMNQHILHHGENIHRRVGEKLKPMLAPVGWSTKKHDAQSLTFILWYTTNNPSIKAIGTNNQLT